MKKAERNMAGIGPRKPDRRGCSHVGVKTGLVLAMALCFNLPAGAAEKAKGDGDIVHTLHKAQGMLRQLSQEKAELEAKAATLQKELDDSKKLLEDKSKLVDAKSKENIGLQNELNKKLALIASHEKNAEVYKKNAEILKTNIETLKTNTSKIKEDYGQQFNEAKEQIKEARNQGRQLANDLNTSQQDNSLLVHAVKERTEWIDKCSAKNSQLIKANKDILENFRNEDFWENLKNAEPLTGIGKVAKENKIEEFRYKLNDLRITPWNEPPGTTTQPDSSNGAAQ